MGPRILLQVPTRTGNQPVPEPTEIIIMQSPVVTQTLNDYAKRPRTELVRLLMGLAGHYKKRYCWPSQDKICSLFQAHTGVHLSRRSLNRQLGALEAEGWIKRTKRHRVERGRGMTFHSTLYTFTRRAVRMACSAVAALALFAGGTGPTWAKKPCAISSSISVSSRQNESRLPVPGEPGNSKKDFAAEFAAKAKALLAR